MSEATILNNPSTLADWPITTRITRLELRPDGIHVEFSKRDGGGSWPDITPPGWDGPLQYTLGMALKIGGRWYASAPIQFWITDGGSQSPVKERSNVVVVAMPGPVGALVAPRARPCYAIDRQGRMDATIFGRTGPGGVMKTDSSTERRKGLALVAFLALAGAGGGAGLRFWLAGLGAGVAPAGSSPEAFASGLSGRATSIWTRLLSSLGLQGARPLTVERLVELLQRRRGSPVARAFAADVLRDPALRNIWDEYRRSGDGLGTPWLVKRFSDSRRFNDLLNRYADDPEFAGLADSLARDISGETVQGGVAGVTGGRGVSAATGGEASAWGPGGGRAGVSASSRARLSRQAEGEGAGPGRAAGRGEGSGAGGEGEHRVLKLVKLQAAGPSQARNPWASLCYKSDGEISREQCAAINRHLGEDALWTACSKAALLDKCVSLCKGNPDLGCGAQAEAMTACRSRWPAQTCAQACSARADCRVDEVSTSVASLPSRDIPDSAVEPGKPPECRGGDCSADSSPPPAEQPETAPPPAYTGDDQPAVPGEAPTASPPPAPEAPKVTPPPADVPPPSSVSPPPTTSPPKKKKKRLPPWLEDLIDFFEDVFD